MKVILKASMKIGGRNYKAGAQELPDNLAHNLGFRALVKSGQIQVLPRDAAAQKVQLSRDAKAHQKAKSARKAALAVKALKSAQGVPGALPPLSGASGAAQPIQKPAKPIQAAVAAKVAPAASAPESGKKGG